MVRHAATTFAVPLQFPEAQLVDWSNDVAMELGWSEQGDCAATRISLLLAQKPYFDHRPFAMCYGGHQFGIWAEQLGDGRAMIVGSAEGPDGCWRDIQAKGLGPTAYARGGDGRAVLRACLREHVASEAMFHLGIPTTRSLALLATGDGVARDPLYDGHVVLEPGGVVVRVAPHFLRFGSLQLPAKRGEHQLLQQSLALAMDYQNPKRPSKPTLSSIATWFTQVAESTAKLIAGWMRVGFVHGVLNTDNMSLLGLTLDYGPFGFMEEVQLDWTANVSDYPTKRYGYDKQPSIGQWNLERLAEACLCICQDQALFTEGLQHYQHVIVQQLADSFMQKLGLPVQESSKDWQWIVHMLQLLELSAVDMTNWFVALTQLNWDVEPTAQAQYQALVGKGALFAGMGQHASQWLDWLESYKHRLQASRWTTHDRQAKMEQSNPRFIPRNHLLQQVYEDLCQGEQQSLARLMQAIATPYSATDVPNDWLLPCPSSRIETMGFRYLSCSS